jgi:hypothetical protein
MAPQEHFSSGDIVLIDGKIPGAVLRQERQYVTVQAFGDNGTEIMIDVVNGRRSIEKQVCPYCGCKSLSALYFMGVSFQGFVCDNPDCKRLNDPNREMPGVIVI